MADAAYRMEGEATADERRIKKRRPQDDGDTVTAMRMRADSKEAGKGFRFLDLPAELRNRIYELACADTLDDWRRVCISFRKEQKPERKQRKAREFSDPTDELPAIPLMALTHASVQLRAEFYWIWLNTVQIPLCALNSFLAIFTPALPKCITENCVPESGHIDTKRSIMGFDPSGMLKVYLRKSELQSRDISRLIKHAARYPDFNIVFDYLWDFHADRHGEPPAEMHGLDALVNNPHPQWRQWVRTNVVSSVRLDGPWHDNTILRIVLKVSHAPMWMRRMKEHPKGYLETLGLAAVVQRGFWKIMFGVDYT